MKNTLNVLRFEYKSFVSAKSFRVVVTIFVVGILVLTSLPQLIGFFSSLGGGSGENTGQKPKAAIVLSGEALTNDIYKEAFTVDKLNTLGYAQWTDLSNAPPSDAAIAEAFKNGDYLFVVKYSGGTSYEFDASGTKMNSHDAIGPVSDYITEVARNAEIAKLPADTQTAVVRISSMTAAPKIIDVGGSAGNNFLIGYIIIMFMLYTIVGYSNYVSSSVVTEKTSKAMELLITAVKPIHLMAGKVVGVGLAALTQVGIIVASFVVGIAINLPYWKATASPLLGIMQAGNMGVSLAVIVVIYFFLGFFLFAFLTAAFASTVTRPEEAATVTILPTLLALVSLLVGFLTLFGVLGKGLTAALSYVPFFTPIGMLARYTLGDAGLGQLVLGVAILLAAIVVVAYIAAKIFRMGVMLYGVKATPRQIWKAIRNS